MSNSSDQSNTIPIEISNLIKECSQTAERIITLHEEDALQWKLKFINLSDSLNLALSANKLDEVVNLILAASDDADEAADEINSIDVLVN